MKAKISEVFVSYQGEGLFLGQKNIFVRFVGCNLSCSYCDEKNKSLSLSLNTDELVQRILDLYNKTSVNIISFTGGEPLLYSLFIRRLIERLGSNFRFLLETNATLSDSLKTLIDFIDVISADIKLPQYNKGINLWKKHVKFLRLSIKKCLYTKIVFDNKVDIKDFEKAVDCVSSVDKSIPFFLQPDTESFLKYNYIDKIDTLYHIACKKLLDVRFVPQIHKVLGFK